MASIFSLLSLSLLLFTAVAEFSDDPIIKQVTDTTVETTTTTTTTEENSLSGNPHHHFTLFKKRFGKKYATQSEHDYRFSVFKANLRQAELNQKVDPSAKHGVTQFSDLSPDEFEKQFLGLKLKFPAHAHKAALLPTKNLPIRFDWRERGAVTPVKNQGGCGSCWSFSATGALEGAHFLATGKLESLSEQQLVDCDRECDPEGDADDCDAGCAGGLMNNAFEYLIKSGGVMKEDDYPYTAWGGTCKFDKTKIAARVANYSVVSAEEGQMAANLVKYGPLPVGINARYMSSYISGVSCPFTCSANLEHGVLIVGYHYGDYSRERRETKPYWIIKNSWGRDWGENGYYKLCRGYNLCGINNLVSTLAAAS